MSFDYFNSSSLAFGTKLTAAFNTLERLKKDAQSNIDKVFEDQAIYSEYLNRNYQVPAPSSADSPCRTNEIFDALNDRSFYLRSISYSSRTLTVKACLFNRSNNRITTLEGSTTTKSGYAYYTEAVSNSNTNKTLYFTDSESKITGTQLFQYRIDSSGVINFVGSVSNMLIIPYDTSQYGSISWGSTLANTGSYTSDGYRCVCIVGQERNIEVKLNSVTILKGQGNTCVRHCIIYLKPKDVISGTYAHIYDIKYNH